MAQKSIVLGMTACLAWSVLAGQVNAADADAANAKAADEVQDKKKDQDHQPKSITIQLENDVFSQFMGLRDDDSTVPGFDGDKDYTNGFRIGISYGSEKKLPFFKLIDKFPLFRLTADENIGLAADQEQVVYSNQLSIGQNIYTPTDISREDIQLNDRPYAGYLYVGSSHAREKQNYFEVVEFDLGLIGPWTGAEPVQRFIHDRIETRPPKGWSHQLKNELQGNFHYMRAKNFAVLGDVNRHGFGADFTPHGTVAIGTVYTHASTGATVRMGTGRDREIVAPNRIQPSMPGTDLYDGRGFQGYVFAGIEARAIARNAFLDGNLFRNTPHSISKEHFVYDLSVGFVTFIDKFRLAYIHTFRSDEFKGQNGGHFFGGASLTYQF